MVDGVLTSCYGSFDHDLAHITMMPMQWFRQIIKWIFGDDNENSVYVKIDQLFGEFTLPNSQFYKGK